MCGEHLFHDAQHRGNSEGGWGVVCLWEPGLKFRCYPSFIARQRDRLYSLCTIRESLAGGTKDNGLWLWLLWISVTEQPAF
jgi:hypothetical protein